MISAEAPVLFAKATEIFIHELTMRAWIHTGIYITIKKYLFKVVKRHNPYQDILSIY